MASSLATPCLVFALFLVFICNIPSSSCAEDIVKEFPPKNIVNKICKKTLKPSDCYDEFDRVSKGLDGSYTIGQVCGDVINRAQPSARNISKAINDRLNQTTDPRLRQALSFCSVQYKQSIQYNFEKAFLDMVLGDFKDAHLQATRIFKGASECQKRLGTAFPTEAHLSLCSILFEASKYLHIF